MLSEDKMNRFPLSVPSKRRSLFSRKTITLFLTVPFLWVLYENAWQGDSAMRRRANQPIIRSPRRSVNQSLHGPIGVKDLADISPVRHIYANHSLDGAPWEEAILGKERVVEVLKRAGLEIDLGVLKLLPTWHQVKQLYGEEPVILGMERCAAFRKAHKPANRYVGIAGQHNCGYVVITGRAWKSAHLPSHELPLQHQRHGKIFQTKHCHSGQ